MFSNEADSSRGLPGGRTTSSEMTVGRGCTPGSTTDWWGNGNSGLREDWRREKIVSKKEI